MPSTKRESEAGAQQSQNHYDAHRLLDDDKEQLIAVSFNGIDFAQYAARLLLDDCKVGYGTGLPYDVASLMLQSAMARKDADAIRVFVNDWSNRPLKQRVIVSKFVPGQHYHALNQKFDTLEQAQACIESEGMAYGGLREEHVYPVTGD